MNKRKIVPPRATTYGHLDNGKALTGQPYFTHMLLTMQTVYIYLGYNHRTGNNVRGIHPRTKNWKGYRV